MDAKRLEEIKQMYEVAEWDADLDDMLYVLKCIDQQQSEIERLNRAVLFIEEWFHMGHMSEHKAYKKFCRIKEGKDGEQP